MLKIYWIFILVLGLGAANAQVQFIDTEGSEIEFEVKKFKIFEVDGTMKGMQGTIRFDSMQIEDASFMVCIDPATVETGSSKRDEHLRSADFFDVENFPRICFTSESFKKTKVGYVVTGEIGVRDVTKKIEIPFTFKNKTFEGEFVINRNEFNVGKDISTFKAADVIEIEIKCKVR